MADVKIVDIDGSQWSMKDQVARDKITELEEQVQINTSNIQGINKDVKVPFKAKRGVQKIIFFPYETCFISGFIQNIGAYVAILSSNAADDFSITDLTGPASKYLKITPLGNFQCELSLDGTINAFGFVQSLS